MLRPSVISCSVVAVLSAAGCGRIFYDEVAPGSECLPWTGQWTLEPPELVDIPDLSIPMSNMFFHRDERVVYFDALLPDSVGGHDVYRIARASRNGDFGPPEPVPGINTADHEYGIVVTPDGLEAWFTTDRIGGLGGVDFWTASRSSTAAPFGAAQPVGVLNTPRNDFDLFLSSDGLRLYASIRPDGSANQDLILASRSALGQPFADPAVLLAELNSEHGEADPTLTGDERVVVFSSSRADPNQPNDLWYAVRPDRDQPFAPPELVPAVNTAEFEGEAALSPDGCELFFKANRAGATALYRARFVRLP